MQMWNFNYFMNIHLAQIMILVTCNNLNAIFENDFWIFVV